MKGRRRGAADFAPQSSTDAMNRPPATRPRARLVKLILAKGIAAPEIAARVELI